MWKEEIVEIRPINLNSTKPFRAKRKVKVADYLWVAEV